MLQLLHVCWLIHGRVINYPILSSPIRSFTERSLCANSSITITLVIVNFYWRTCIWLLAQNYLRYFLSIDLVIVLCLILLFSSFGTNNEIMIEFGDLTFITKECAGWRITLCKNLWNPVAKAHSAEPSRGVRGHATPFPGKFLKSRKQFHAIWCTLDNIFSALKII
jgi:hypothetical protein